MYFYWIERHSSSCCLDVRGSLKNHYWTWTPNARGFRIWFPQSLSAKTGIEDHETLQCQKRNGRDDCIQYVHGSLSHICPAQTNDCYTSNSLRRALCSGFRPECLGVGGWHGLYEMANVKARSDGSVFSQAYCFGWCIIMTSDRNFTRFVGFIHALQIQHGGRPRSYSRALYQHPHHPEPGSFHQ